MSTATLPKPKPAPTTTPSVQLERLEFADRLDLEISEIVEPKGEGDRVSQPGEDKALAELAASIAQVGVLSPILVERLVDGRLMRVFGARRIKAAKMAGLKTIPAYAVPPLDEATRRTVVAAENAHRLQLTPIEEHMAVNDLLSMQALHAASHYGKALNTAGPLAGRTMTQDGMAGASDSTRKAWRAEVLQDKHVVGIAVKMVAAMLAKSETWVTDRMYLSKLGPKGVKLVGEGKLPLTHARIISRIGDPKVREDMAESFAAGGDSSISDTEPGELEKLEDIASEKLFSLKQVSWKLDVPFANQPACVTCPNNSDNAYGLFRGGELVATDIRGDVGIDQDENGSEKSGPSCGTCMLPSCFRSKTLATRQAINNAAKRIVESEDKSKVKTPAYVPTAAITSRVKVIQAREASTASMPAGRDRSQQNFDDEKNREAKRKLASAEDARAQKVCNALEKLSKSRWYLRAVLGLMGQEAMFKDKHLGRRLVGAEMKEDEAEELVLHVARSTPKGSASFGSWEMDPEDFEYLAETMGMKLGKAPVLADFLPKPKPAAKASKPAGKTKPKGKAKKELREVPRE